MVHYVTIIFFEKYIFNKLLWNFLFFYFGTFLMLDRSVCNVVDWRVTYRTIYLTIPRLEIWMGIAPSAINILPYFHTLHYIQLTIYPSAIYRTPVYLLLIGTHSFWILNANVIESFIVGCYNHIHTANNKSAEENISSLTDLKVNGVFFKQFSFL